VKNAQFVGDLFSHWLIGMGDPLGKSQKLYCRLMGHAYKISETFWEKANTSEDPLNVFLAGSSVVAM
jgi:hypothetical protein